MERIVQRKRRREWQPEPREPRIAFAFALHCVLQETRAKLLVGRFSGATDVLFAWARLADKLWLKVLLTDLV